MPLPNEPPPAPPAETPPERPTVRPTTRRFFPNWDMIDLSTEDIQTVQFRPHRYHMVWMTGGGSGGTPARSTTPPTPTPTMPLPETAAPAAPDATGAAPEPSHPPHDTYCYICDYSVDNCACARCPGCDLLLENGKCPLCHPIGRPDPSTVNPPGSFDAARYTRRSADGALTCNRCGFTSLRPGVCQCCRQCDSNPCTCCRQCGYRREACTCVPLDQVTAPAPVLTTYQANTPPEELNRPDRRESVSRRASWIKAPGLAFFPPELTPLEEDLAGRTTQLDQTTDPGERKVLERYRRTAEQSLEQTRRDHRAAIAGGGPRRYVSVEIEVGGLTKHEAIWRVDEAVTKWKCATVHDGSLPNCGFEINTAPAKGKFFVDQVTEICKALRVAGAWVNIHCGLHVHVDSRDLSAHQVLRLIEVYAKIEDGLFLTVPDSRRRNNQFSRTGKNYCEKCGQKLLTAIKGFLAKPDKTVYWGCPTNKGDKKETQEKKLREARQKARTRHLARLAVYTGLGGTNINAGGTETLGNIPKQLRVSTPRATGQQVQTLAQDRYSRARYYALNLHTHFYTPPGAARVVRDALGREREVGRKRGTIESRLAAGTTDPKKIIPWALLWDQLLYVATAWSSDQIKGLPPDPWKALLAVAPSDDVRGWLEDRKAKFAGHQAPPGEDF